MADQFELQERLGKGGMGTVWKARDRGTGETVALKVLHAMYADEPDYIARFEREVELARRIDSPHVVKVLGYGQQDGLPYMAMEYVEGRSLKELLKERGKLSWEEAKPILVEVAEGLAAAHQAGVIHRDVKPSNILIGKDGSAKLADFGIARALDLTALTGSNTMLGTPHYMAPEGKPSVQSDLYSLGCVAYEALTGATVFSGDSAAEVLIGHIRETPDLASVPLEARPVLDSLLAKEPRLRPGSAKQLLLLLQPAPTDVEAPGQGPAPQEHDAEPQRSQSESDMAHPRVWLVGGLILGALVLVATVVIPALLRSGPTAQPAVAALSLATSTPTAVATPPASTPSPAPPTAIPPTRERAPTPTATPTPLPPAPPKISSIEAFDPGGNRVGFRIHFQDPNGDVVRLSAAVPGWTFTATGDPYRWTLGFNALDRWNDPELQIAGSAVIEDATLQCGNHGTGTYVVTLTDAAGLSSPPASASFFC